MGALGDRLSQVGGVVFGSGVTIGAGWGIWAAQSPTAGLWDWPIWPAIALCVLGGVLLGWSFFGAKSSMPDGGHLNQEQSGGAGSVNIQAGRDITYKSDGK